MSGADGEYGPGKIELGLFVGGFISNYFHQFYDVDAQPNREELNRLAPWFGGRFSFFPARYFGVEGELSLMVPSTKMSDESAIIFGLGGSLVAQKPLGRLTPFVLAGASVRHVSSDDAVLGSDTDVPIHLGGGARFWINDSFALRADIRFLRGPSQQDPYTLNASYGEFSLGLSFNPTSKRKEAPPPPDPDPDGDGVMGTLDVCPNESGGTNPDGCPTRDADGDAVADADDQCKDQAETVNQYMDKDGCPDTVPDTDGDGFDDFKDTCVNQAEDKDGFQDEDGCPDADNDNDGVLDAKDKCPAVVGPVENAGCPDTDGDGDGIVDRLDNCPTEKGTEKNHGCKAKQLVVISSTQLKILDQVKFVTGSAKLSRASNKLLNNIVAVLKAHPEIVKIKIEGHTDNVGKPEKNLKLSQDRADSVLAYLVAKGIEPDRLESVGHGDTKPLEDNTSAKGRAQNRRVEFNIVGP